MALVCTTADRFSHKLKLYGDKLSLCCGDVWRSLDSDFFRRLHYHLDRKAIRPEACRPRPHQEEAISTSYEHFSVNRNSRGKLIMPSGTGKSLTAYWIAKKLEAKKILLAVPSLALIRQTLETWTKEAQSDGREVNWICVCSDPSVKEIERDDLAIFTQDLGVRVHTDPNEIAAWLGVQPDSTTLVLTTYQSGEAVGNASKKAEFVFDVGILDEAHKTAGNKDSLFSYLLHDQNIAIKHRLFMTATERRYKGRSDKIVSMEDPQIYGDTFHLLSFKKAMECQPPILSDYKIVTIVVNRSEVAELITKNSYIRFGQTGLERPEEAETLATAIALRKAMLKYPICHSVSFHSSVKRARIFKDIHESLSTVFPDFGILDTFHVSGETPTAVRSRVLDAFAYSSRALVTNARCLTEGIDLPNIDCVIFADPKKSAIDIVQATGRALRRSPGKELGYVIIPVLIADGTDPFEEVNSPSFGRLLSVLKALAANDERIIEYFRSVSQGERHKSDNDTFVVDVPVPLEIDPELFAASLQVRLWPSVAKLAWRPFSQARDFARSLKLRTTEEWIRYRKGEFHEKGSLPEDIPADPAKVYKDKGWNGYGDWLGTGAIANQNRQYRSFEDARSFVSNLGLENRSQWARYCKGKLPDKGILPEDIPAYPEGVYRDKGWDGYGDWLGTGTVANQNREYRSFGEARLFVRKLGLKSKSQWARYCRGEFPDKEPLPPDIPSNPPLVYKDEWTKWGDWFGTGTEAPRNRRYRSFQEARKFVHGLHLRNTKQWRRYCRGEIIKDTPLPKDIPADPSRVYKNEWTGLGDWFGTDFTATWRREYRSFKEAREFVRSLEFKGRSEWQKYCKGEVVKSLPLPADIPADPYKVYIDEWIGWGDFFGTGHVANWKRQYVPFEEARSFARSLKLKSQAEWQSYCKGELPGKPVKPDNIPADPRKVYKDQGWISMGDWLGTGIIAPQYREYRSFESARHFVRKLCLLNQDEWKSYCKGELPNKTPLPDDIPRNPHVVYKSSGWVGLRDWLGTNLGGPNRL